jgi:hypothetical protein
MSEVRKEPCQSCPYRKDVPSGIWSEYEYDKLVDFDLPTGDQPMATFACHATPGHYCHGWAVVHSNRGPEYELLGLRVFAPGAEIPEAAVPLFESGQEAADHGKRDIDNPSPEARAFVERLVGKYDRLQWG